MATNRGLQTIIRALETIPKQVIRYISGAVTRIFGPIDDDYPETGVQPFEGDPADGKSS
ncbi:hypothetical protein J5X98_07110 [Leptothermofonsia sichuanensis E412]|uniref:hypothetical protein n=1 Tax=Leptothermofonsia sichuanensis TaxID=2917832 RepID=UPI001CA67CDE|nr:hypothetical protein [Leptothermofonsia sichuanensis]QZZ22156.1 hypothetical protein J5X98_07110 [Leptothermofonsia sichuanensis E412]